MTSFLGGCLACIRRLLSPHFIRLGKDEVVGPQREERNQCNYNQSVSLSSAAGGWEHEWAVPTCDAVAREHALPQVQYHLLLRRVMICHPEEDIFL